MTEYHFNAEDLIVFCPLECGGEKEALPDIWEGGGGYFRTFWVGVCCRDPGILSLYQS